MVSMLMPGVGGLAPQPPPHDDDGDDDDSHDDARGWGGSPHPPMMLVMMVMMMMVLMMMPGDGEPMGVATDPPWVHQGFDPWVGGGWPSPPLPSAAGMGQDAQ